MQKIPSNLEKNLRGNLLIRPYFSICNPPCTGIAVILNNTNANPVIFRFFFASLPIDLRADRMKSPCAIEKTKTLERRTKDEGAILPFATYILVDTGYVVYL